jgi:outer membrane protein OmpA-like peptidoglycan-associated protein
MTVDASTVANTIGDFGHGYYAINQSILFDARCALGNRDRSDRRLATRHYGGVDSDGRVYYEVTGADRTDICIQRQNFADGAPAAGTSGPAPPPPPPPPPVACPTFDFIVYFEWDRSNLNQAALETIDASVIRAHQCNVSRVLVVGHTDSSGATTYNQNLSERRASVVRDALVARGI